MMRVELAAEPVNFRELVQQPGDAFTASVPHPTEKQWKAHNYWRRVARELHDTYEGICAYYCQYIPFVTGSDTVDHFRPKKKHPKEAYKWKNYRLVSGMMNGRKKDYEDIIDPFLIDGDWFIIDFDTYLVKENPLFSSDIQRAVRKTIDRLKLNNDNCVYGRIDALTMFAKLDNLDFLDFWAPFLARELRRQNLAEVMLFRFQELLASRRVE